jgi:hypothetical protein
MWRYIEDTPEIFFWQKNLKVFLINFGGFLFFLRFYKIIHTSEAHEWHKNQNCSSSRMIKKLSLLRCNTTDGMPKINLRRKKCKNKKFC